MIAAAWAISILICLPPLIQWGLSTDPPEIWANETKTNENFSIFDSCSCSPMDNGPIYIVFSALGSFYVPMFVVIGVYIKVYKVVREASKTLSNGYLRCKFAGNNANNTVEILK